MSSNRLERPGDTFSANAALIIANEHLSSGAADLAATIYTKVLTDLSPGHPAAFLNRAHAYLHMNHPSLAAIDARRAIMAAHFCREIQRYNIYSKQLSTYWREIEHAKDMGAGFAKAPTCWVGAGSIALLDGELSKIYIEPRKSSESGFDILYVQLSNDVTMKAYYILAVSLHRCGQGALRSALEVLAEVREMMSCTKSDIAEYRRLENAILEDFRMMMDKEEAVRREFATDDDGDLLNRILEEEGVRGLVKMRYTSVKDELYPWDKFSAEVNPETCVSTYNQIIEQVAPSCVLEVENDSNGARTYALVAKNAITSGQTIAAGCKSLRVSSKRLLGRKAICEQCGVLMAIPKKIYKRTFKSAMKYLRRLSDSTISDCSLSSSPEAAERQDEVNRLTQKLPSNTAPTASLGLYATLPKQRIVPITPSRDWPRATRPRPPLGLATRSSRRSKSKYLSPRSTPKSSFCICITCCSVAYCSEACNVASLPHHYPTCNRGLEEFIDGAILPFELSGMPCPRQQYLVGVLMIQLLAQAQYDEQHPLEGDFMRLLEAACHPTQDQANDEGVTAAVPWNYEANVTRLLNCLFTMGGASLALDARRFDGWVLNTMMARIHQASRIDVSPLWEKHYNIRGEMVFHGIVDPSRFAEGGVSGHHNDASDRSDPNKEVWVAMLDPLANLMQISEEDECANVWGYAAATGSVYVASMSKAAGASDDGSVCIRAGERLVREADIGPKPPHLTAWIDETSMHVRHSKTDCDGTFNGVVDSDVAVGDVRETDYGDAGSGDGDSDSDADADGDWDDVDMRDA